MNLPRVGVVLYTFEPAGRPRRTAARVLSAILDQLHYSGEVQIHIADDGSPDPEHVRELITIAGGAERVVAVTNDNAGRHGYGRSHNLSTIWTHPVCPVLLPLEDDWLLTRDLDLDPLVETLMEAHAPLAPMVRSIRLGYVGWTADLRGTFVTTAAGKMILLDPDSPETHVVSFGPRLETREYQRDAGEWPVDATPGVCEMEIARRPAARVGVAWPLDYGPASMREDSLFAHIGTYSVNVYAEEEQRRRAGL